MAAPAIDIDGSLLRSDREARDYTRDGLSTSVLEKTGRTVSASTLQRAEENGRIGRARLRLVASVLGYPEGRYLNAVKSQEVVPVLNVNGWWTVYYREDDVHADSYVARERLHIVQHGQSIEGVYEPGRTDHPENHTGPDAFVMSGYVGSDIVYGSYARGSPSAHGTGVFQVKFLRDGGWAEGVCSFVGDDAQIMVSLNVWVKEDHEEFRLMKAQAERLMAESKIFPSLPISPSVR